MARSVKLLLKETVDNLGIVGDVVNVRTGYARNYLLPRQFAMQPSPEAIAALASKRAEAERQIAEQRAKRAEIAKKIDGIEVSLIRPCNDMGILYGAVTQQEISTALHDKGHEVRPRDVRLPHAIKRVDTYEVHIKFEADLEATIRLHVLPDRKLDLDDHKHEAAPAEPAAPAPDAAAKEGGKKAAADEPKAEKGKKAAKGEAKAEDKKTAKSEEPAPAAKEKKGGKKKE